jgi:thioredoxin reductase (NADPH)
MYDLVIIGAGPVGLEAAIQAKRADMKTVVLEKGSLLHTIYRWPVETVFFSEARNLEIGGHPFPSLQPKPTRREALLYYRRVAEVEGLAIRSYTEATAIRRDLGKFKVDFSSREGPGEIGSRFVLVATGYYDNPNRLGVPGEDQPHVHYGIRETLPYWNQQVVIVGGSNSAIEAALDLYRAGAKVTLVHREAEIRPSVKYWLKPDFENRVKEGSIGLVLNAEVSEVREHSVVLGGSRESKSIEFPPLELPADFVIVHIGYHAVDGLLRAAPVEYQGEAPLLSEDYESSVKGLFVAGSAGFGPDTRTVFIENGREHAQKAVREMVYRLQQCFI